jgi:hypothetical protein
MEKLKAGQSVGFVVFDIEKFVELRDGKDFVDLWPDVAELELAAVRFDFLVERDQLAERGAGKELDGGKVQQQILALLILDELEQLLPEFLDVGFVKNFSIDKAHDADVAHFVQLQSPVDGHPSRLLLEIAATRFAREKAAILS